jgi:hypothetical protein
VIMICLSGRRITSRTIFLVLFHSSYNCNESGYSLNKKNGTDTRRLRPVADLPASSKISVGRSGESGAVSIPTVEQCAEELPWSNEFTHPENGEENEMETNLPGKVYERRARSDQRS